jgi:hypothetical protein
MMISTNGIGNNSGTDGDGAPTVSVLPVPPVFVPVRYDRTMDRFA